MLRVSYSCDAGVYGFLRATCPHCREVVELQKHHVTGNVLGFGFVANPFYECPRCGGKAHRRGVLSRIGWSLVLAGVLVAALLFVGVLGKLFFQGVWSAGEAPPFEAWAPMALVLAAAGFGCWKLVRALIGIWTGLSPTDGIHAGF